MAAKLVSESITVDPDDLEPPAAIGEPGAPRRFTWRGEDVAVAQVLRRWRETRDCTHGSGEQYAFKHWFEVESGDGRRMRIYFERKARSRADRKRRWWLYSVEHKSQVSGEPQAHSGD